MDESEVVMGLFSWEPKISGHITSTELRPVLTKLAPNAQLIFDDKTYLIPADPEDVIYRVNSKDFGYIKQSRDCDDAVRIFRGKLSQKGFGNLLAIDTTFYYFSKTKGKKVLHKAITFLYDDKLIFGEPQTGKIVEYSKVKIERLIL